MRLTQLLFLTVLFGMVPTKYAATFPSPVLAEEMGVQRVGDYRTGQGLLRVYLKVDPGLSDVQVIKLMKTLHAERPAVWFWLLDDDRRWKAYRAALVKAEKGDLDGYPLEWIRKHAVANLVLEVGPAGRRWVVYRGAEREERMAVLEP